MVGIHLIQPVKGTACRLKIRHRLPKLIQDGRCVRINLHCHALIDKGITFPAVCGCLPATGSRAICCLAASRIIPAHRPGSACLLPGAFLCR